MVESKDLLKVTDLSVTFRMDQGSMQVLDSLSYTLKQGEIVAMVGESGCGKSVSAKALLGLLDRNAIITDGVVTFDDHPIDLTNEKAMDQIRGNKIAMIFQDPLSALDPLFTIGDQLNEAVLAHRSISSDQAKQISLSTLKDVGFEDPVAIYHQYPHTLSGGMRQRALIAMALVNKPSLLIADEPTTALDVTIQANIMALLKSLRDKYDMTILLITHDMGVVATMADRVMVMYAGQIIESADVFTLFDHPAHPYTHALMGSVPSIHDDLNHPLISIKGMVPSRYDTIQGCRFASRCPYATRECGQPIRLKSYETDHMIRCIHPLKKVMHHG